MMYRHIAILLLTSGLPALAQEQSEARFGGPDAVENQVASDMAQFVDDLQDRLDSGWVGWKKSLQQDHGVSFTVEYSSLGLFSSEEGFSGKDSASGGMVKFLGAWEAVGRGTPNSGALVWKIEDRHKYGSLSPQDFGFDQGYVGFIEPPFSDEGTRWTNLYWRQRFNSGRTTVTAGLLDATDFLNLYSLASPWTGFMNFAFSTGSAAMFIPNDATTGIGAGTMLTDQVYLIGSVVNAYTDPTEPFDTFSDFFSEREYFSSIELGWSPAQGRIFFENAHVTLWHVDESIEAGTPGGWGAAFNVSKVLADGKSMPFIRGGYADEGGTLLERSLSLGYGYSLREGNDQFGVALNWGKPNEDSFGPDLDDQYVIEAFYRWQATRRVAVTPDIQYIKDPANNPRHDSLWILGFRFRVAF